MKNSYLFSLIFPSALLSCHKGADLDVAQTRAFPIEYNSGIKEKALNYANTLPDPAEISKDHPELVALGKKLFYDNRLSGNGTQSCNSCHNLSTFGVDNKTLSKGADGRLESRNTPTVLNASLHFSLFWDGRAASLEEQIEGPILNPHEMGMSSKEELESRLSRDPEYIALFRRAFPADTEPLNFDNLSKALGAFERTLLTPSRFDKFLLGDESALSEQEKRGLSLFVDLSCIKCHSGNTLGGNIFQKFGLVRDYWEYTQGKNRDEGLFQLTKDPADKYVFKVPSLRNVAKTAPYFHDGSVETLEHAIAIMAKAQLGMELSSFEVNDIKAFLEALTGEVPASALQ